MNYLVKTRCATCETVYSFAMQNGEIAPSFCAHCGSAKIEFEDGRTKVELPDLRMPFKVREDIEDVEIHLQGPVGPITFFHIPATFIVASLSNPACAPLEERCGTRAIVWRLVEVPWNGPPRLCACCHAIWTQHGVGHHYGPVPTERIALLGCDAMVRR